MKIGLVFIASVKEGFPDKEGKRRLEKAINLLSAGFIDTIMISGGHRKRVKLVEVYRKYLPSQGITDDKILLEGNSNSTASNLLASSQHLINLDIREKQVEEVWFCCDFFQLLRILILLRHIYWPWKKRYAITGVAWSYLPREPIKILANLVDLKKRFQDWCKKLREESDH